MKWLNRQLKQATVEVKTWPKWKQDAMREAAMIAEMEKTDE